MTSIATMKIFNAVNEAIVTATRLAKRDLLSAIASDYALNLDDLMAKYCPEESILGVPEQASSVGSVVAPPKALPKAPKAPKAPKEADADAEGRVPCSATNKKNKPCKRYAQHGCTLCKLHIRFFAEGGAVVVEEKTKKRAAELESEVEAAEPKPKSKKSKKKTPKTKVENDPGIQAAFDEIFEEALQPEDDDERTVTDPEPEDLPEDLPEPEEDLPEPAQPESDFDLEAMLMKELAFSAAGPVDILADMPEPEELARAARRTPVPAPVPVPEPETMSLETLMREELNEEDADLLAELTKAYPISYDVEEI
jgi:hypothetical protein